MWEAQVAHSADFRVIRHDTRAAHLDAPPGSYTIERLGMDALALLDQPFVEHAHLCGLSLGGVTALWLAVHQSGYAARSLLTLLRARHGGGLERPHRGSAIRRYARCTGIVRGAFARPSPDTREVAVHGDMLVAIDPVDTSGHARPARYGFVHASWRSACRR
jgi:pimeloyl-ACP methyl ester carboxylesterase